MLGCLGGGQRSCVFHSIRTPSFEVRPFAPAHVLDLTAHLLSSPLRFQACYQFPQPLQHSAGLQCCQTYYAALGPCLLVPTHRAWQEGEEPIDVHEAAPAPAAKKGGKPRAGSAEVTVKDDWLAEHAAQVACMLPGGAALPRRL